MCRVSRRRFLQVVAGAGALVGLARGQAETFELLGQASGWEGSSPAGIEGEKNPTLGLRVGRKYVIAWENLDGQPHNIAIADGEGNVLEQTEVIEKRGATQTLEFTATPRMSTYFSEVDPETMRGDIETREGTATTNTTTTTATTTTTSPTTEATGATAGTDTANDGGQSGFGIAAALGGLAGVAYLLRRSD